MRGMRSSMRGLATKESPARISGESIGRVYHAMTQRRRQTRRAQRAQDVYRLLLDHYGVHTWERRAEPLEELIFTVLSQHTSDVNTFRTFADLRAAFPTWQDVVDAPTEAIAEAIKRGGLSRIKATRIQAILREIERVRGELAIGFLAAMPLNEARQWLLNLPGVGEKTAACVLLFSFGLPALPVDTHVHRVSRRLGLITRKTNADKAHYALESLIEESQVYQFHVDLIEHGRRVCHARRPNCADCLLSNLCPSSTEKLTPHPA